jgi:ribose/xylose/arabinose/galactoside ABC-type transport system permease subunit
VVDADTERGVADAGRDSFLKTAQWAGKYAPVVVLVILLLVATVVNDVFWNVDNIRNILSQNAATALVALGMTFVIIGGAFDLSVGALYAAGAVFFAKLTGDWTIPVAGVFALLIGCGGGLINGLIITRLHVNPFIGTIGTAATFGGLVHIYSNSSPVQVSDPGFRTLGLGLVAGIPWPVVITVLSFVVGSILLSKTVFGRYVYAAGGNAEAARLAGVPVASVGVATFVIVGCLSALAGMVTASQLSVGQPTLGATVALDAFAIVVIGGTSVYGGEGALWRTATGVLIIAVLTNIFNYMAWDDTRQSVAKGVVLVAAVALDATRRRLR